MGGQKKGGKRESRQRQHLPPLEWVKARAGPAGPPLPFSARVNAPRVEAEAGPGRVEEERCSVLELRHHERGQQRHARRVARGGVVVGQREDEVEAVALNAVAVVLGEDEIGQDKVKIAEGGHGRRLRHVRIAGPAETIAPVNEDAAELVREQVHLDGVGAGVPDF